MKRAEGGIILKNENEKSSAERRPSIVSALFGCWHWNQSRPITVAGDTYRTCLQCGARRRFDKERMKPFGPYYFPVAEDLYQ